MKQVHHWRDFPRIKEIDNSAEEINLAELPSNLITFFPIWIIYLTHNA